MLEVGYEEAECTDVDGSHNVGLSYSMYSFGD
jgi:hypothetical protein